MPYNAPNTKKAAATYKNCFENFKTCPTTSEGVSLSQLAKDMAALVARIEELEDAIADIQDAMEEGT